MALGIIGILGILYTAEIDGIALLDCKMFYFK